MGPKTIRSTVLSAAEEAAIVAFRKYTLLPLDDCLYSLQASIPHLTRSSLHRCLQRHGISRLPKVEDTKPTRKKFKPYPIGYLHVDIAEVQTDEDPVLLVRHTHEKESKLKALDALFYVLAIVLAMPSYGSDKPADSSALEAPSRSGDHSNPQELRPRCDGPFQLCGYVEKDSRAVRIPLQFEVAEPFSEGLAAVRIEGRYGFIDTTGKIVIAPRFQAAGPFAGKYAEIRLDNASGIVNRSGKLVVPPGFNRIIPFTGDTFIAEHLRDKRWQISRLEAFTDTFTSASWEGLGLFHAQKGWLSDQNLKFRYFDKPERGLVWAGSKDKNNDSIWGLMRSDGAWQVKPRYHNVHRLMENHAIVASMPDYSLPPPQRWDAIRWGTVDRDGNLVVPLEFVYFSHWHGRYGYVREGKPFNTDGTQSKSRVGIVRADGTLLAGRYFDGVEIPEDGGLPHARIGKTWYSIESDGRLIPYQIPDQLDEKPLLECPDGLTVLRRGEHVEFLRPRDGKSVGRFDTGYFQKNDCPGPFSAKRDEKWYFILENGSVLGGKNGFEETFSFSGSHAAVRVGGKWGIIDRSGAFTVKPRFAMLRPTHEGTFTVEEGGNTYWINGSGKRVAKPTPEWLTEPLTCVGGLRFFQKNNLWGLRDSNGKTVIAPRFRALSCFKNGISWVAEPDRKAWCPIGPDGQRRDAMECIKKYYPALRTHSSPERFSEDPYENSVLWNRAWLDYQAGKRDEPPKWNSSRPYRR
jgi:hypothetical protein